MLRIILATSKGEVLRKFNVEISAFRSKFGTGSFGFWTVDLDAKYWLKILLCSVESCTIISFSNFYHSILQCLWFFISLNKILNFFFADIEGFLIVSLTELWKAVFAHLFTLEESLAASLALEWALFLLFSKRVTKCGAGFGCFKIFL